MARPRVFDYDAESDEQIVTKGVEGFILRQAGFLVLNNEAVFVLAEGTLTPSGDAIETITRTSQYNLEGQDFNTWYLANKDIIDNFHTICLEKAAEMAGKTGSVVES